MFRTHTPIRDNKTNNHWFVVNSFKDLTVSPRQLLQSINTNSKLRTENKEEKNNAQLVSKGFRDLVDDLKASAKLSRSILKCETVEVLNNRYDLRALQKK